MDLKGKTVLVTGGSRGIGKAVALAFAKEGANVIINYISDEEGATDVIKEIKDFNVEGLAVRANVSKIEEVNRMIGEIEENFGGIDILVNNAGITKDGLFIGMKEEDWDRVIEINLKGVFLCTKAVIRKMIKQKHGRIINISSVVGVIGNPGQVNYCASKAGVIGFTKSLAREVASRNITVNAIAPGFIETDMTEVLPQDIKEGIVGTIPMKRYGKPEDVANTIVFLGSGKAGYITGQIIHVDGGMAM
ncbi:MAG TPA: 3-oxoacyl-[acyl-carrier-protein] reductase [Clostridia bacterium]|nr:3-oxoacyl-[acyl-carrier-protein] reductase [Clostridia bacterium]